MTEDSNRKSNKYLTENCQKLLLDGNIILVIQTYYVTKLVLLKL